MRNISHTLRTARQKYSRGDTKSVSRAKFGDNGGKIPVGDKTKNGRTRVSAAVFLLKMIGDGPLT
jgi:hypothetical protein